MLVKGLFIFLSLLILIKFKKKYLILMFFIIFINVIFRTETQNAIPVFSFRGGADFGINDTLVFISLLLLFFDICIRKKIPKDDLIIAVNLFLLYLIIPSFYTLLRGEPEDYFWLIRELRGVIYYLILFPFVLAIKSERDLRFVINIFCFALLISFFGYCLNFYGIHEIPGFGERYKIVSLSPLSVQRLLLITDSIPQAVFFLSLSISLFSNQRRIKYTMYFISIISIVYIIMLFTRTIIITTIAGTLLLMLLFLKEKNRPKEQIIYLIKYTLSCILLFAMAILVIKYIFGFERVYVKFVDRLVGIGRDGSILLRFWEWKGMITNLFMENPITGAGIGRTYKDALGLVSYVDSSNSLIWLLAKTGIIGLLLYSRVLFIFFRNAIHNIKVLENNYLKGVSCGVFTGALMLFFNGLIYRQAVIFPPAVILFCFYFAVVFFIGSLSKSTKDIRK